MDRQCFESPSLFFPILVQEDLYVWKIWDVWQKVGLFFLPYTSKRKSKSEYENGKSVYCIKHVFSMMNPGEPEDVFKSLSAAPVGHPYISIRCLSQRTQRRQEMLGPNPSTGFVITLLCWRNIGNSAQPYIGPHYIMIPGRGPQNTIREFKYLEWNCVCFMSWLPYNLSAQTDIRRAEKHQKSCGRYQVWYIPLHSCESRIWILFS